MINSDTSMMLKSLFVLLAGVLVATGHLPSANSDSFVNDATAFGGTVLSVVGSIYFLEHQWGKVKQDWSTPPTPKSDASSATSPLVSSAPVESTTPAITQ